MNIHSRSFELLLPQLCDTITTRGVSCAERSRKGDKAAASRRNSVYGESACRRESGVRIHMPVTGRERDRLETDTYRHNEGQLYPYYRQLQHGVHHVREYLHGPAVCSILAWDPNTEYFRATKLFCNNPICIWVLRLSLNFSVLTCVATSLQLQGERPVLQALKLSFHEIRKDEIFRFDKLIFRIAALYLPANVITKRKMFILYATYSNATSQLKEDSRSQSLLSCITLSKNLPVHFFFPVLYNTL